MSFSVKSEILSAIAKTDDAHMKTLLLLMLGVLEEIGGKVDQVLKDERTLRTAVLNGHEPVHHNHHEWIGRKIKEEAEVAQDAKDAKKAAREAVIRQVVTAAVSVIASVIGTAWVLK